MQGGGPSVGLGGPTYCAASRASMLVPGSWTSCGRPLPPLFMLWPSPPRGEGRSAGHAPKIPLGRGRGRGLVAQCFLVMWWEGQTHSQSGFGDPHFWGLALGGRDGRTGFGGMLEKEGPDVAVSERRWGRGNRECQGPAATGQGEKGQLGQGSASTRGRGDSCGRRGISRHWRGTQAGTDHQDPMVETSVGVTRQGCPLGGARQWNPLARGCPRDRRKQVSTWQEGWPPGPQGGAGWGQTPGHPKQSPAEMPTQGRRRNGGRQGPQGLAVGMGGSSGSHLWVRRPTGPPGVTGSQGSWNWTLFPQKPQSTT